jgi:hypothetical protein
LYPTKNIFILCTVSCFKDGFLITIVIPCFIYSCICEMTFSLKLYFSLILFWYYHYLLYACPHPSWNTFSASP